MGLAAGGAGHGDWTLWYIGLGLSCFTGVILLASVCTGIIIWIKKGSLTWWTILGILILLGLIALGIWGLQG